MCVYAAVYQCYTSTVKNSDCKVSNNIGKAMYNAPQWFVSDFSFSLKPIQPYLGKTQNEIIRQDLFKYSFY